MSDLELTRLCAEAMGYTLTGRLAERSDGGVVHDVYDPLHDDAQAMALVKRFNLTLRKMKSPKGWMVSEFGWSTCIGAHQSFARTDLNRAIVETVAKIQKSITKSAQSPSETLIP